MTLILLTGSGTWAQAQTKAHTFSVQGDNQFWLDDKPSKSSRRDSPRHVSGRILETTDTNDSQSDGCNTVACYIMWNYHESEPECRFSDGNKNLENSSKPYRMKACSCSVRTLSAANGLWRTSSLSALHTGYKNPLYGHLVYSGSRTLCRQDRPIIKKYEITNGGPIIMVQVENE